MNTDTVQQIVRERLAACGNLTKDGTHVCILPVGHEPTVDCPSGQPPQTERAQIIVALRNRRFQLQKFGNEVAGYESRLSELDDVIAMLEGWESR